MSDTVKVDRKLRWSQNAIEIIYAHNKSSGTVAPGDIVILDTTNSTATEVAFTTTTTADNKLVLGMAIENMADGDYGQVQTKGPTDLLKVNGTTDIALGDLISTYTTAKIGAQATVGKGGGFAIALETYTGDNNNGVINAWLTGSAGRVDTSSQSASYASPTLTGTISMQGATTFNSTATLTCDGSQAGTETLGVDLGDLIISDGKLTVLDIDSTTDIVTISTTTAVLGTDKSLLYLDSNGNIAADSMMMLLDCTDGTPVNGAIGVKINASGKLMQGIVTDSDRTGGACNTLHGGGALTDGNAVLLVSHDGDLASGGNVLKLLYSTGTVDAAACVLEIDGSGEDMLGMFVDVDTVTGHMVQFHCGGTLASNKAALAITSDGTLANGSSLVRIESGATADAIVYGLEIACDNTNVEALYVSKGESLFAEAVTMGTTSRLQFHDEGLYIYASTDGQLDVVADTLFKITAITNFGADGAGLDCKLFGGTSNDYVLYDASDGELEIVNTAKTALTVTSAITGSTNLKAVSFAVADATTLSGAEWDSSFFVEVTKTGTSTPTEYSGVRFNLKLNTDTYTGDWNALKVKVGTGATPTVSGAAVHGVAVSIDEIGSMSEVAAYYAEMYTTTTINNSFFLFCQSHGAAQVDALLGVWGTNAPNFLLRKQTAGGSGFWDVGGTAGSTMMGHIAVEMGGNTGYINVYSDNS